MRDLVDRDRQLERALERLPAGAAFTGLTALWLHGLDVEPTHIEVALRADAGVSARSGMVLNRSRFDESQVVHVRGFPAVPTPRAIADASRRLSVVEAVVIADAALHARRATMKDLVDWATSNAGQHGMKRFRRAIALAEPASESPMESRLRVQLILGGLPRPQAQVKIYDSEGRFVGRPDLYYPGPRLGIEYDGATHRDSLAEDDSRQNELLRAGVRLLRFTARDVLGRPDLVVRQVRDMLKSVSAGTIGVRSKANYGSAGRIVRRAEI